MKLNAKTEYALLAMVQLAEEYAQGRAASMRTLADRQPIPDGFLVQILQDLRRAGLVASTRGATGGYRLVRSPGEISISDVVGAMEGDDSLRSNLGESTPLADVVVEELESARVQWRKHLGSISLEELSARAAELHSPMWYI